MSKVTNRNNAIDLVIRELGGRIVELRYGEKTMWKTRENSCSQGRGTIDSKSRTAPESREENRCQTSILVR